MHRIRLREPWKADRNADSGAIVYTRNFHKPTGVETHMITLCVALRVLEPEGSAAGLSVLVNGRSLTKEVSAAENREQILRFQLTELAAFNSLELRISPVNRITGANGPKFPAASIPTFGSFVIESVELQIE